MNTGMLPDLNTLLTYGRPAEHVVALTENAHKTWQEFVQCIAAAKAKLQASATGRVLLTQTAPLDFLANLLAAVSSQYTAVLPPNFQRATLNEVITCLDAAPAPEAPSLELFTSGSSGEPKRIQKKLTQLEAECRALEILWGTSIGDAAIISTVPHHHIYGLLFRLLWPVLAGRPFDALTAGEPTTLHARLDFAKHAVLVSSPAQLARLPELHDLNAFSSRPAYIFSSGGPLAADVALAFQTHWGITPHEVFGSTESGGIAWRQQLQGNTAWSPLPGVRVAIETDGALQVRSPFLENDQPLRMEDGAVLLPDNRFELSGRLDRIVKIEEKRLSLPDLEARLTSHSWVEAAAAAPVTTNNGRRTVVGVVLTLTPAGQSALHGGRRMMTNALRTHLAQHFDHVLLPRRWRFTDQLPYNDRGKLPLRDILALLTTTQPEEIEA